MSTARHVQLMGSRPLGRRGCRISSVAQDGQAVWLSCLSLHLAHARNRCSQMEQTRALGTLHDVPW